MLQQNSLGDPIELAKMTFLQVESVVKRSPTLLVPLGGLEPLGPYAALETLNVCTKTIAHALSGRLQLPVAPLFAYGATTPFKAFGGVAGVRPGTLCNLVMECCNDWLFQGFKRIVFISLATDAATMMHVPISRLQKKYSNSAVATLLVPTADKRFLQQLPEYDNGGIPGVRNELALLSLALFISPKLITSPCISDGEKPSVGTYPEAKIGKQWHRRGRDPVKLRNLAPQALFSAPSASATADLGEALFKTILTFLADDLTPYCTAETDASQ